MMVSKQDFGAELPELDAVPLLQQELPPVVLEQQQ